MLRIEKIFEKISSTNHSIGSSYVNNKLREEMEEIIRTTIATTIEEIIQYSNLLCFDRATFLNI